MYDKPYFEKAAYHEGATDAVRVISLKAGWQLLNKNPVYGTGFGDLKQETGKWYVENYPQMVESDKIDPSSEWLIYGAGCGWLGVLVFSFVMLVPFRTFPAKFLPWWCLNITAAFSFLFDIGLEVQFGVFIYAFIVCWWWKWFNEEKV